MNQSPSKRTALITGANRGIGLETARQLAERGYQVIIAARDATSAGKAVTAIQASGGDAEFLPLDVSQSASIVAASQALGEITDRLDVLVNNAGIYPDEGWNLLTLPREQLAATFATNAFGPLELTQALLPYLRRAKGARVINLSSSYGQLSGLSPEVPSYCLSKFALNGLTIMLADALRDEGIVVNALCPGWVRTDMGGSNATLSVAEGADTVVWLADEADAGLSGKLFRSRQEIRW
ncbi:SDR family oxidoreductase [Aeoliella mucimassa]|uniref:Rhamnolipids biosynthesis 3-oxoacyl-[acyl-carrier-protein] reductase n=1 Tax=Aeoliella mucimassa TaxID=2527972 RepID=A0A518AH70_9BACT|nr:SDR family oxidoreductase [Aeoliella mucimassa]QDU54080.1 Rhamnolipids biosynthesis 3-oxoacyl-[acyl-carrier-protein] reductase [Aeoliella mucimassa]